MKPLLSDGETVTVFSGPFYWPGDILFFRQPGGELRLHRLIGYRLKGRALELITRGDRSDSFDTPIRLHDVVGKVRVWGPEEHQYRWIGMAAWAAGFLELIRLGFRQIFSRS